MIRILRTVLTRPPRNSAALVAIFAVLVLTFGTVIEWYGIWGADQWMPANRDLVFEQHQWWRLLTTMFVHADPGHLIGNSALYFILAYFLYGHFGLVIFPFLTWLLAIPMTALALASYPSATHLIGASGVVNLMGGLWLSLYLFVARDKSLTGRTLRAGGVMLGIFFPTSFEPQVSYRTHFIGLAIGLVGGTLYYHFNRSKFQAQEVAIEESEEPLEEKPLEFDELLLDESEFGAADDDTADAETATNRTSH